MLYVLGASTVVFFYMLCAAIGRISRLNAEITELRGFHLASNKDGAELRHKLREIRKLTENV